jgi:hypothetical protein
MDHEDTRGNVRTLAHALGIEPWQTVALLGSIGVDVDPDTGRFDPALLVAALKKLARRRGRLSAEQRARLAKDAREQLLERLIEAGLRFGEKDYPKGTLLMFNRPVVVPEDGDDTFAILTYVSTSLNRFDQVSFTVNRMHDKRIHWIALIAIPFDQVYLHRRTELLREFDGRPSASITIRRGTPEDNLFERRLDDLLHDYRIGEEWHK